jgi:hypothetical protein
MTLAEMLTLLRHEARLSADAAHGTHLLGRHVSLLARTQETLYDDWDWPLLRENGSVLLDAGQRFASIPANLSHNSLSKVFARATATPETWRVIGYGIDEEQLNHIDSDANETAPDVVRWRPYLSPAEEDPEFRMFEVWPIPARPTSLRFVGKRRLPPLTDVETHASLIDGPLIVLMAAAEILAAQKAEDAGLKLQLAADRYSNLKATMQSSDNRTLSMVPGVAQARGTGRRFRLPGE